MIKSITRLVVTKEENNIPLKYFTLLARYCKDLGSYIIDVGELELEEEFDFIKPNIFVYFKMKWNNETITTHIVKHKENGDYAMIASIYTVSGEKDEMVTTKLDDKDQIIVSGILDELYQYPLPEEYLAVQFTNNAFSFN